MRSDGSHRPSCVLGLSIFLLACGGQGTGADGGGKTTAVSDAVAVQVPDAGTTSVAECPTPRRAVTDMFPDDYHSGISDSSADAPDLEGGTLVDGTYYLSKRITRGSGGMWQYLGAILVVAGSELRYFTWHLQDSFTASPIDSAFAGTFVNLGTSLDTSGMKKCWGDESLPRSFPFSATSTEICLRRGAVDFIFERQIPRL
jgi:hypothetical protein